MKKLVKVEKVAFLLFVTALLLSGCATGGSTWKTEDITSGSGLKGLTEEQVVQRFGPPDRIYMDSIGNRVLEYKKETEKGGAMSTMTKIGSFGILSGKDSGFVDILRIVVRERRVVNYSYEENVMSTYFSGAMGQNLSAVPNENSRPQEVSEKLKVAEPKPEKVVLKTDPSPVLAAEKPQTARADPPSVSVKPTVAKKGNKPIDFTLTAQYKSSKMFPGKKEVVYNNIVSGAKNSDGMSIKKAVKEKGALTLSINTEETDKPVMVNVTVSQTKQGAKVELSLVVNDGSFYTPDSAIRDFCKIYDICEP